MRANGGAIAGGNPRTVEAGLHAFALGGNAVDAAVAGKLMACVAEPLLTGLAGGGLAIVRAEGVTRVLDGFSNVPGLGATRPAPAPREVVVDFGPDRQVFHFGAGSVAVPALAEAIWALHQAHGRVPLPLLAAPAVAAARGGVEQSVGLTRSARLLAPILKTDATLAELFFEDGEARPGHRYALPALGDTIERLAAEGPGFLRDGEGAADLLATADGRLTAADLAACRPIWREPLTGRWRDARLFVPGPPSCAGSSSCAPWRRSRRRGLCRRRRSASITWCAGWPGRWPPTRPRRAPTSRPGSLSPTSLPPGWRRARSGFTTHLSTVDAEGGAVGFTGSLGETAGLLAPRTGLILNNFLGEADVYPPPPGLAAGARLMTMCCPTLLERPGGLLVLGSGGSSRIRSALLHAVVYAVDHPPPVAMVEALRAHFEGGILRYETAHRPADHAAIEATSPAPSPSRRPASSSAACTWPASGLGASWGPGSPPQRRVRRARHGAVGCYSSRLPGPDGIGQRGAGHLGVLGGLGPDPRVQSAHRPPAAGRFRPAASSQRARRARSAARRWWRGSRPPRRS
ncbi:MAG: gamma-glutamyltransferase [bacterium]